MANSSLVGGLLLDEVNLTLTATTPGELGPIFVPQYLWTIMNGIAFIAICINILHIIFMTSLSAGRRTGALNFKHYILVLAYTDLVGSLFRLCVDNRIVQQAMFDYKPLCVFTATFIHGLNVFESTQLALVGIERYIAVQWPTQYVNLFYTQHFFKLLIGTCLGWWLFYIIIAVVFHERGYSTKGSGGCQLESAQVPQLRFVSSSIVALMLAVIIIFYCLLLYKATSIMRRIQQTRSVSEYRQIRQITLSVNVIVLSKIFCWSPLLVAIILRRTKHYHIAIDYVGRVFLCLYCVISPILYGSTSTRYRRYVKRKFCSAEVTSDPLATSVAGHVDNTNTTNSRNTDSRDCIKLTHKAITPVVSQDVDGNNASEADPDHRS